MGDLRKLLGASIRRHRSAAGLTQAQLAEVAHRSTDLISRIERGDAAPSLETVQAISDALDVTPAELFGGQSLTPGAGADRLSALVERLRTFTPAELEWLGKLLDVADARPR